MTAWTPTRRLRRRSLRSRTIRLSLLERRSFLREFRSSREILFAIEEYFAVYEGGIHSRINTERMTVPDCEIRIFADVERADTVLNTKLNRRIERHELQRLFFRQIAPVHCFGRFDVQTTRSFVGVGIHRHDNAGSRHDRCVIRNRVVSFDLVTPRISKDRRSGAVRCDLFRDLVALERVLERFDLEAKLVRKIDQHQDLARDVAVRVNVTLALENFDEWFEL